MTSDIQPTGQPLDLDAVRRSFADYRQHQGDSMARGWSCCSAHGPADRVPALLAEVERLNKRLNAAHDALTRVEDDDPDEFVSLESTVEWVVTHYRALRKDFDELHDMLGTDGGL